MTKAKYVQSSFLYYYYFFSINLNCEILEFKIKLAILTIRISREQI